MKTNLHGFRVFSHKYHPDLEFHHSDN